MKNLIRINAVATLLLFGVFFGIQKMSASGGHVGSCPAENTPGVDILLPDAEDCSVFYKCDWGTPVLFVCPDDLLFSVAANKCDHPDNVNCGDYGIRKVRCDCGWLWGTGCAANNYGATCWTQDEDCTKGNKNCNG